LKKGYLVEFFGRKEIRDMFIELFSYDRELFDQGRSEGRIEGIKQSIEKTLKIMRNLEINEDIISQKLREEFQLSDEELEEQLNKL